MALRGGDFEKATGEPPSYLAGGRKRQSNPAVMWSWIFCLICIAVCMFVLGWATGSAWGSSPRCQPNYSKASQYVYPDERAWPRHCEVGW